MQKLCVAFFAGHFLLIAAVICRDTFWIVGRGLTLLPASASESARKGELFATAVLGLRLPRAHPFRQSVDLYLHGAGIESGYGFFAPNVGGTSRLVFELQFVDGRVEYEPAGAATKEDGLRLATFMDYVSRTESDALRMILIRSLAQPIWDQHSDLVKIRAILGTLALPSGAGLVEGKRASFEFLGGYDLTRPNNSLAQEKP